MKAMMYLLSVLLLPLTVAWDDESIRHLLDDAQQRRDVSAFDHLQDSLYHDRKLLQGRKLLEAGETMRINAGGPEFVDNLGRTWEADHSVFAGTTYEVESSPQELYSTGRKGVMLYNIPLPNGEYEVTLHFWDSESSATGERIFDIICEGQTDMFFHLDVYSFGQNNPTTYQKTVYVSDGNLSMFFFQVYPRRGDPIISGIEILRTIPTAGPVLVNIGGDSFVDHLGRQWLEDKNYMGLSERYSSQNSISGMQDEALAPMYDSGRKGVFRYELPVVPGTYDVTFHFAEVEPVSTDEHVFDFFVDGKMFANVDVHKMAGGNNMAATLTSTLTITDGGLSVIFFKQYPVKGTPMLSGVEIVSTAAQVTPAPVQSTDAPTSTLTSAPTKSPTSAPIKIETGAPTTSPTSAPLVASSLAPVALEEGVAVARINCGSSTPYKDRSGNLWSADDKYFRGGEMFEDPSIAPGITGTDEPVLYSSDRNDGSGGFFRYHIEVPAPARYTVVLHFVETFFEEEGRRQFNILIEGNVVEKPLDIFKEVGKNVATSKSYEVETDYVLNIDFRSVKNRAKVSAIEVIYKGALSEGSPVSTTTSQVPTKAPVSPTIAPVVTNSPTKAPTVSTTEPTKTLTTAPIAATTPAPFAPSLSGTDYSEGAWIEIDVNAPINKRHEACFVMVGRKAYLVGGRGIKPVDIYDPVTRTWSSGAPTPIELHHFQCIAVDNKLWIVGAFTGSYPREMWVPDMYIYDPATDSWSTKKSLSWKRNRGSAAVIYVDYLRRIYVSHGNRGGHETENNDATALGWLDYYDIDKDIWVTNLPDAPNPRDHTGGALINGKICVAGGRNTGELNFFEKTILPTDCFDLATETWSVEADIPVGRAGSAYGTSCDGKLIVAGGEGVDGAFDTVDIFDGNSWTTIDNLTRRRHGSGLAVDCLCNQIHIASGSGTRGGKIELKSVETFFMNGTDKSCPA